MKNAIMCCDVFLCLQVTISRSHGRFFGAVRYFYYELALLLLHIVY